MRAIHAYLSTPRYATTEKPKPPLRSNNNHDNNVSTNKQHQQHHHHHQHDTNTNTNTKITATTHSTCSRAIDAKAASRRAHSSTASKCFHITCFQCIGASSELSAGSGQGESDDEGTGSAPTPPRAAFITRTLLNGAPAREAQGRPEVDACMSTTGAV